VSRTQEKLNEARFFLGKLDERNVRTDERWQVTPELRYYLSAFISAARSVTWVMRSEYQGTSGWNDWYDSKKPVDEGVRFLKGINDLRVRTEKLGPLEFHYMVSLVIPNDFVTRELEESIEKNQGKNVAFTVTVSDDESMSQATTIVTDEGFRTMMKIDRLYISLDGFLDDDLIDVCRKYCSIIERLVIECETQFGADRAEQPCLAAETTDYGNRFTCCP